MNYITILIGLVMCGFGIWTLYVRKNNPEKFKKLPHMQKLYGQKLGLYVHIFGYSLVPILLGCYVIYGGSMGKIIFEVL